MATSSDDMNTKLTFRKFDDGDNQWQSWSEKIFVADESYKCPTYVHQTPPCQGSCPAGEDIRGWLQIVRGIEKPIDAEMSMSEYAFRRSTDANPFPSVMGRVPGALRGRLQPQRGRGSRRYQRGRAVHR